MDTKVLKDYLDKKVALYNTQFFISSDPIQVPKQFSRKEDIEIMAFLTATFAWGKRSTIINSGNYLGDLMNGQPYKFVINFKDKQAERIMTFVHRTFGGLDCIYFLHSLRNIYLNHGGLEKVFLKGYQKENSIKDALYLFREVFFEISPPGTTSKHVANVARGSAAKRLNMFLRWMVRRDERGVDFGLWKDISPGDLKIPLDVHVGKTARDIGLLSRKQDDWKSVVSLTDALKEFDSEDPVKYDFALFGVGIFEN